MRTGLSDGYEGCHEDETRREIHPDFSRAVHDVRSLEARVICGTLDSTLGCVRGPDIGLPARLTALPLTVIVVKQKYYKPLRVIETVCITMADDKPLSRVIRAPAATTTSKKMYMCMPGLASQLWTVMTKQGRCDMRVGTYDTPTCKRNAVLHLTGRTQVRLIAARKPCILS